jgi:ferritin-like metal-binding protein YciE
MPSTGKPTGRSRRLGVHPTLAACTALPRDQAEADDSPCPVIHAIEKDCNAAIENTRESIVDAVILAGAAEAEHYEIAVYEALVTNAEARGASEIAALLRQNLEQELSALEKFKSAQQRISHEGYAAVTA